MTLQEAQDIMENAIKEIQADGTLVVRNNVSIAMTSPQEININPENTGDAPA